MRLFLFLLCCPVAIPIFAQQPSESETRIRLNRHFFEIAAEDTASHVYDKLVSFSADSTKLERIFTREGQVQRVVMTQPPREEYYERVTDQYNEYHELEWRKTENLHNGKFLTVYYFDGKVVGQVLSDSTTLYHVARNGESEPTQQNFNDFEPQIAVPTAEWHEFLFDNLRLSTGIRTDQPQIFWIAILVDEHGMAEQIEWANPLGGNPKVAKQYLRVVRLWGNNYTPALDSFGNPVAKWLMIPFRVERAMRGTTKPIMIYSDFN
ncbi:hypothetical protein J0A68_17785 [Algoriphagus sp. H41]|uniref:GLPGLI family protein n=1 Tax=Algoriphagus oliviformis TaxID=2811231 RepID=A0ABS3C6S7_9BACT|nr:hypothetical protein [Algoriphagus oliviformis]MBN7812811.1 hypothetical protein [Algoriphagus oliviformis]